jgi:hypothetical protein
LTSDGVGVSGGTLLSAAAARRLRRGVAGASGFLKTASSDATFWSVLALLGLGFFATEADPGASAGRFFVEVLDSSGVVARVALATRVERRSGIVLIDNLLSMQHYQPYG